ncbi:hypothetical protein [Clostridium sp. Marseille-Q7071]
MKLIRPFYSKESRKLAQDALNYKNKKYKIPVKINEYVGVILHFIVVIGVISNIYSMIPSNHLVDKTGTYIVISSIQDKALISKFSIETMSSGTEYIVLNKDTIQISSLSKLDYISQNKKLFISGKVIK